ncbi:MAG: hypothetical protein ABIG29_02685 [Candidatus Nealsonbacteria bacterium]
MDRFSSYRYGEGRTGIGQLVEFACPTDVDVEEVRGFLKKNVRTIDIPTTGQVNVPHGGYGMYTRYQITQHDYAGGGCGYIEVLEIKDPPGGRCGFVIHEYRGPGDALFSEWEALENARAAFKRYWGRHDSTETFPKLLGFKRFIPCGALSPWFYAIGDEELIGDYAFPEGLQDDPVYRVGRQFVVFDRDGIPAVKTCMGTRFVKKKQEYHPYKEYQYRLVYWDDGSIWDEANNCSWWGDSKHGEPRPVEESELWIAEAVRQFRQLLAGKSTEFTINFTDGNKFAGRLKKADNRAPSAEGNYFLVVRLKGEKKPKEGWVDFKPTPEAPDIVQYVTQHFTRKGKEVECVEIKHSKAVKGGKKWKGVFLHPPK